MMVRARSAGRPVCEIHRSAGEPSIPHPRCAGRVRPGAAPGRPECCGARAASFAPCYPRTHGAPRHPPHPLMTRAARFLESVRIALAAGATTAHAIQLARDAAP